MFTSSQPKSRRPQCALQDPMRRQSMTITDRYRCPRSKSIIPWRELGGKLTKRCCLLKEVGKWFLSAMMQFSTVMLINSKNCQKQVCVLTMTSICRYTPAPIIIHASVLRKVIETGQISLKWGRLQWIGSGSGRFPNVGFECLTLVQYARDRRSIEWEYRNSPKVDEKCQKSDS